MGPLEKHPMRMTSSQLWTPSRQIKRRNISRLPQKLDSKFCRTTREAPVWRRRCRIWERTLRWSKWCTRPMSSCWCMSSKGTKLLFGMITRRKIGRRLRSTLISSSWTWSSGRIWWLLFSTRRLSYSISSRSNLSNRLTLTQIQQDSAPCHKPKSQFPKLFVCHIRIRDP